jgi:hypothetical protein
MPAFNPDCDDLNEYFYTSFVEMWEFLSSPSEREDGINTINDYRAALGKTDKFIDWVIDQLTINITDDKYFVRAVLNTIDIDGLMARLNDWMDEHTCAECHLILSYCECECDSDEEDSCEDCDKKKFYATTIVTGIVCNECKHKLPPMTMQDHLDGKFNQECPHSEILPTTQADPADSKGVQGHSHRQGTAASTLVESLA